MEHVAAAVSFCRLIILQPWGIACAPGAIFLIIVLALSHGILVTATIIGVAIVYCGGMFLILFSSTK